MCRGSNLTVVRRCGVVNRAGSVSALSGLVFLPAHCLPSFPHLFKPFAHVSGRESGGLARGVSVRACRLSAVVVPGRVRNIHVVTTRRAAAPPSLPSRQSLARLPVGRVGLGSGGSVGGKTFHVRSIGSGRGRGKRAAVPYPRRHTSGFPVGPGAEVDPAGVKRALACGLYLVVGRGSLPVALSLDLRRWFVNPPFTAP